MIFRPMMRKSVENPPNQLPPAVWIVLKHTESSPRRYMDLTCGSHTLKNRIGDHASLGPTTLKLILISVSTWALNCSLNLYFHSSYYGNTKTLLPLSSKPSELGAVFNQPRRRHRNGEEEKEERSWIVTRTKWS